MKLGVSQSPVQILSMTPCNTSGPPFGGGLRGSECNLVVAELLMGGAGGVSWSVLVPTVQTVRRFFRCCPWWVTVEVPQTQTQFIHGECSLVANRDRIPQVQFLDKLFFGCGMQHIVKAVDVPVVMQRQVPRHGGGLGSL